MVYHATSFSFNSQAMLWSLSNRRRRRLDEVKGAFWIHECKQEAQIVGRWRHPSAHFFTPPRLSSSSFFTNNTNNQLLQHISPPILRDDAVFNPISSLKSYPLEESASKFQDAFWRFLRPHTIRGTVIATTSLVVKTLVENSDHINWSLLPRALCGLLALLCGNGFIVGINQIYDVSIDKVNKPFLPIAAGDFSIQVAWVLVVLLALAGIGLVATNFSPLIAGLYVFGLFLGSIYSVPPLRLKRFPVAAFLIIATARGFLLNFGVYHATRAALVLPFVWSPSVIFITIFVTLFATVIAITKDLPDIEGDRKFDVPTFATKAGAHNIALLGSSLLLANYIGAMAAAYIMPLAFRRGVMMFGHLILATSLIYQTWLLHISNYTKVAIMAYYRFIWTLFYAEYALFPFI